MSDLINRLRTFGLASIDDRKQAATLIEQQADQLLDARRTAEYWKAEHNAANARIAALEAQIATVAPAVDAQPVAIYQVQMADDSWMDVSHEDLLDLRPEEATRTVYTSAQSEGLRKDAQRYRWIRDVLRLDDVRWMNIANWNQANISAEIWDREIDAALSQHKAGDQS